MGNRKREIGNEEIRLKVKEVLAHEGTGCNSWSWNQPLHYAIILAIYSCSTLKLV